MSKYLRSRPQPSTESVRRAKHELRAVVASTGHHSMFSDVVENDRARNDLLDGLRNFRPTTVCSFGFYLKILFSYFCSVS